ncbi:A disintegrin and metalloproteinase with thrombospondin motifs adt-2 isoform X1 [Nilaparvata lugens]|uniref:A disintegrin and metalloproteinase with thrombospondin motifs adt-2 isoform X1 n=1 Tax=Nilaparvata lugens TaxID=108931 RepID=UPI00193E321D|nr:A disintegrin and metalloproteinase with thrombospondin motifs adt-2 isoform X1 [Nilaparvata lugens]
MHTFLVFQVRNVRSDQRLTLETALFFDEAGYKLFSPYFENNDDKLKNMLLAYLNGVQALYHHPSLGLPLDIALVRLEVFKVQPTDLPHYYGEREALLDSFCAYNAKHNPPSDEDQSHWDIGLYVSGLDFFAVENGRRSDVTMGLSAVGGICSEKYSCVIAEFGTTNALGKPYPSAGFTSVYVLAHEIGHNLGMHHDSMSNNCPRDGFIMSPSRSVTGETEWSVCSAQIMQKLRSSTCLKDSAGENLMKGMEGDTPGVFWGSKRQCELLLRDGDATAINTATKGVCENLECETPHRTGRYFAGPALDGTSCETGKWCIEGSCVKRSGKVPKVVEGGWSKWSTEKCISGCTQKSKGFQKKHRSCDNPRPVNTDEGCIGPTVEVALCNDEKICHGKKRLTSKELASKKCKEFGHKLKNVDGKQPGFQAPHETGRPWVACSVFCHRKDSSAYYTPRLEFNDVNIDPFLPDGTWCHNDGATDYYCQQHNCLPAENNQLTKSSNNNIEDLKKFVENALPGGENIIDHDNLLQYFSLDKDGKPFPIDLPKTPFFQTKEDEWSSRDYIDLKQSDEVEELQNLF